MKKLLLFLIVLSSFAIDAQTFEWVSGFHGNSNIKVNSIDVDQSDNSVITGQFNGTIDLDPGAGVSEFTSAGQEDIFICKLDPTGGLVWGYTIGSSGVDYGTSIDIDDLGNIILTGEYSSTVDFDNGLNVNALTAISGEDQFILKLDSNGDFIWVKSIDAAASDANRSIKVNGTGDIYLTGNFVGTVDFDPNIGVQSLSTTGGFQAAYILKLDANGDYVWANKIEATSTTYGFSLGLDQDKPVITGGFMGTVDLDPGAPVVNETSNGVRDIFVLKLSESGLYEWSAAIGGSGQDTGWAVAVDENGNSYVTGSFGGTVDFDPSNQTSELVGAAAEIFVLKLNSIGNYVWAKAIGGSTSNLGLSIDVDHLGNCYTTGYFYGTADFDPSLNTQSLTASGTHDAFLSKLDSNGNHVWAYQLGGAGIDQGWAMRVGNNLDIYTTGFFEQTVDFDIGPSAENLTSTNARDGFVHKIGQCASLSSFITETACDTYLAPDGQMYSNSGVYTAVIQNSVGCDSVITIDLTINTVDATTTQLDDVTIQANLNGVQYQWVDCDDNFAIINGATNQTYTATVNGNYSVIVFDGNCSDTSDCVTISKVSLEELTSPNKELVKIVNLLGQETPFKPNTVLIYIYSNGTSERVFKLEE